VFGFLSGSGIAKLQTFFAVACPGRPVIPGSSPCIGARLLLLVKTKMIGGLIASPSRIEIRLKELNFLPTMTIPLTDLPPFHARVQFVGGDAIGRQADGVAGKQDERRPSGRAVPAEAWAQVRGCVNTFEPYDRVKEENSEARAAAKALIEEGKKAGPARKTFVFVNNRLEGNALATIAAVTAEVGTRLCVGKYAILTPSHLIAILRINSVF
jgi:hypothetical protein